VFLMAAGATAVGFALSLLLPERPLREAAASSTGLHDSRAAPRSSDSLAETERALTRVTTPEERTRFRRRIAERAGVDIRPGAIWALVHIDEHGFGGARTLAEEDGVPPARIAEVLRELREQRLVAAENGAAELTASGREHTERLLNARCEVLAEALADGSRLDTQSSPSCLGALRANSAASRPSVKPRREPGRSREWVIKPNEP
jgi:DNA-binding MarR family transcriptional regulator